jgi:drug/metabolite transporter (DMT)-like permease
VTTARAALPILVLTLVWGCNWPILKMGVEELAPLTFRGGTPGVGARRPRVDSPPAGAWN